MKKKPELTLYRVTLDWCYGDPEQGDYCSSVWAEDDDAAIRLVAEEMADSGEVELDTPDERDEFIADRIAEAGPYGAEEVAASLLFTVRTLMAGPKNEMTADAQRDYERIAALLSRYGAKP
jgi:hypothetical protein